MGAKYPQRVFARFEVIETGGQFVNGTSDVGQGSSVVELRRVGAVSTQQLATKLCG